MPTLERYTADLVLPCYISPTNHKIASQKMYYVTGHDDSP